MVDWLTKEFGAAAIAGLLAIGAFLHCTRLIDHFEREVNAEFARLERDTADERSRLARLIEDQYREAIIDYQKDFSILKETMARLIKAVDTLEAQPSITEEERLLLEQTNERIRRIQHRMDMLAGYLMEQSQIRGRVRMSPPEE